MPVRNTTVSSHFFTFVSVHRVCLKRALPADCIFLYLDVPNVQSCSITMFTKHLQYMTNTSVEDYMTQSTRLQAMLQSTKTAFI